MELVKELVKGYRQVPYNELQSELNETFHATNKTYVELAYELEVRSVSTAQNAIVSDNQMVSDEILTKVFNIIGLNAFVVWMNGERKYYLKN